MATTTPATPKPSAAAKPTSSAKPAQRVRTPTVLQMEAVECGAAALAIVLAHYGRWVPLEELRVACGVSRDGTKAANILKAARTYGLKAKGYSKQVDDLPMLPLPIVVFWNFNHFLVVEGFAKGKVYLNDPAMGPRVVTDAEFEESFTGVVLVFEPAPEFEKGGSRPSVAAGLFARLRGSELGLLYVILASLALAATSIVVPILCRSFVDSVIVGGQRDWLGPLLLALAVASALQALFTGLQLRSILRLATKLSVVGSYRFVRHLLRLPMDFFTQRYGGEIGSRVQINDRVAGLLADELAANLLNFVTAALYLGLMLYFSPLLTLVAVIAAALNVAGLWLSARARSDSNTRLLQERGKMVGTSMAGLQAIESVKASGGEVDLFRRWSGQLANVVVTQQRMEVASLMLGAAPALLTSLAQLSVLGVGAWQVMSDQMTIGTLFAFQLLLASFIQPVNNLLGMGGSLQTIGGELSRLDDVFRHAEDPALIEPAAASKGDAAARDPQKQNARETDSLRVDEDDGAPGKLTGRVELRGVTYGYNRLDAPLIRGFNLVVPAGARVALVGFSASGKSTISKLIGGLYQPWEGQVLFDGRPRAEWPREVITRSVAMVDQDFFLFAGTVRDVLTMWDATVPEEDLIAAAKDACIHDDIAARPKGYASPVEEGGRNFSGGQRQRLEIARALVGNPSVLVLDEATSALDPTTERQIDENLRRRGCTCVIVAHRLSTIRDCDEILVLDHGVVAQRGTHDRLKAGPGLYRQLITAY
ncbi:MAG TPA: NHLP family bacteriocin export ABC transporter peptidase/permease/ATPase subunit [Pirellulales bacterium]